MKISLFCSLLCILWILSSCSFYQKDPVILQIHSKKWTGKQFAKLLAKKIRLSNIQNTQNQEVIENLKERLIGDLVMEYLIKHWAKVYSISISEKELQKSLQKIKNSYPSDEVFNLYLQRKKINKTEWVKTVKNNLLNKKVMQQISSTAKKPTIQEIQEYYKNNPNLFRKNERILIHHIFHKQKDFVLKIRKRLKQGETIKEITQKFINNPQITKAIWIEKGTLELFDKAFHLKIKEISPVWSSAHAYHIIQVLDKKPAQTLSFDKAKAQISQKLLVQRQKSLFAKWMDTQVKKLHILKNEEALKKIKVKPL